MSYILNKTDGSLLVELIDGQLDTSATDITLVGRNYKGFGEFINENFIAMLENFASVSAPENPLLGQVWYDTNAGRLKIYDGNTFKSGSGAAIQSTAPNNPVLGDLWIDNRADQFFFYTGTNWLLIGPNYTTAQGKSGLDVFSVLDSIGINRVVTRLFVQGTFVGLYSNVVFTPVAGQEIAGIPAPIQRGFTPVDPSEFSYNGTALNARNLITETGVIKNSASFIPADANGTTVGNITIQNNSGLTIGTALNNVQKVVGTSFVTENTQLDHNYRIRVRSSAAGFDSVIADAVTIDTANARVGIFQPTPTATLDVTGDARITGNLIVEGTSASVEVTNLAVADKNIELASTVDDSTILDDAGVDNGGVLLMSSQGIKELIWKTGTAAWTSSEHVDIASSKEYKIAGVTVLSATALSGVTSANDLLTIGALEYLDVDSININGSMITESTTGLNINSAGTITLTTPQKITGLLLPDDVADAANKEYVDTQSQSQRIGFALDITGLNDAGIIAILESLHPAAGRSIGSLAYIATTSLANATVSGIVIDVGTDPDTSKVLVKSLTSVDKNGIENQSVVEDITDTGNNASGTVTIGVARGSKEYIVNDVSSTNTWQEVV